MLCILSFKNPNGENLKVLHIIFKRYCLIKNHYEKIWDKTHKEKSAIWYVTENSFKTQWEKYKEKLTWHMWTLVSIYCLIKNLLWETMRENSWREKEYNICNLMIVSRLYFRRLLTLNFANLEDVSYQFHWHDHAIVNNLLDFHSIFFANCFLTFL